MEKQRETLADWPSVIGLIVAVAFTYYVGFPALQYLARFLRWAIF